MSLWVQAGLWGLLAGGALVVGALIAWFVPVSQRFVASVMAFGAGVLISALAFDLVDEAEKTGGLGPTVIGFLGGALTYVVGNVLLARRGAHHRKSPGADQMSEEEQAGSGTAIALGALLDGVPESTALGLSLLSGEGVGIAVFAAIAISNLPEGLSSAAGMKHNGRSVRYVFGVWIGIALACGIAGGLGCLLLDDARPETIATITAVAAGAILAMIADTMIPEAFKQTHLYTGLITTVGFIVAFGISHA